MIFMRWRRRWRDDALKVNQFFWRMHFFYDRPVVNKKKNIGSHLHGSQGRLTSIGNRSARAQLNATSKGPALHGPNAIGTPAKHKVRATATTWKLFISIGVARRCNYLYRMEKKYILSLINWLNDFVCLL